MDFRNQIIATAILSTIALNIGLILSWPAANIMVFASEHTTLNRPLTETEISLLGSLSSFGALLSTLIAGFMLDLLGRKKCSVLLALILILVWAILSTCNHVEVVLTCMFLSGMSGSIPIVASVYISEICHESIRGSMTACLAVSYNIGGLLAVGFGGSLSYNTVLYIGLLMTVGSTTAVLLMKDSPTYLLRKGKEKDAAKALAFYTGLKEDDKEIIEKLNIFKREFGTLMNDSSPEAQKLNPIEVSMEKLSVWQFMKKSESSRRALLLNSVLIIASNLQGVGVVQIYIQPLVADAVPSYSPVISSVVMAVVAVIAGVVGAYMTDVAGRRPLMIYGSIGSGICCLILGTQMQFYWGPTWITLVFIYMFTVTVTLGACTVPLVLLSELYLPEVRSILSMIVVEINWISKFIVLSVFSPTNIIFVGWGIVFYIFAVMCFLTSIFTFFYLPETMRLTVEDIQPLFLKKEKWTSCKKKELLTFD